MRLAVLAAALILAPLAVHAADGKPLGTFGKWTAFTNADNGKTICYAALKPAKTEGTYKARGDVLITVTHRPSDKSWDVVSIVAGYQYLGDSDVAVNLGKKKWDLFTSADRAWARDAATDKQIVDAMAKGGTLTVKGTSRNNTPTTDTFELKGFAPAYKAINEACKKPSK